MSEHATWSPSSASRNMACAGALAMEKGEPDSSGRPADEGTFAHGVGARCLTENRDAADFIGFREVVNGTLFEVDDDMAVNIQRYLDGVRAKIAQYKLRGATKVDLLVEVRVNFSRFVGIPNQFGTSDVVLLVSWPNQFDEIHVADLKYGYHRVSAKRNKQMMLYALGAYDQFAHLGDFGLFSMAIHQPRIDNMEEDEIGLADLIAFGAEAKAAAAKSFKVLEMRVKGENIERFLTPSDEGCRWCKAKPKCPALARFVAEHVFDDFEALDVPKPPDEFSVACDLELLSRKMKATSLVETWIKAVRGAVESKMFSGETVPGYKLVMGKQGNRKYTDEIEAEAMLKSMRLKQEDMYSFKVKSPTQMEKVLKDNPRKWNRLQLLISRRAAVPSVAPMEDSRPTIELKDAADDFDSL